MADYYDRLGDQLADLTARGAHRRRFSMRLFAPRPKWGTLVVSLGVLVVVVVGVVFFGVGVRRSAAPAHTVGGPAAIRSVPPTQLQPLPGQTVCDAELQRPGAAPGSVGSPSGVVQVNANEVNGVNQHPFSITASGLRPNAGANVYAVWLLPAVGTTTAGYQLTKPETRVFVGLIKPGLNSGAKLAAQGLLPSAATGTYEVLVTLEPHPSTTALGRTVLQGFISF